MEEKIKKIEKRIEKKEREERRRNIVIKEIEEIEVREGKR